MRDFGPIGFSFSGDIKKAGEFAQLARKFMGQQSNYMSFRDLPSHIETKQLDNGVRIKLIQLPGGIKRIHIFAPSTEEEVSRKGGGIVAIPKSNEYTGWGFDYVDGSGNPLNEVGGVNLGTEDGDHKEVIHIEGKVHRSDVWWPRYSEAPHAQEQEDRGYGTYSELECGLIDWKDSTEKTILSWKGKDRYFNRYYNDPDWNISTELYREGFIFTKAPNRIVGAAVCAETNQLIAVTYEKSASVTYRWYCRNYKDTYDNDNVYSPGEPDGWRSLGTLTLLPDSGVDDHVGSGVLFNTSGTECVLVLDQGTEYRQYGVDTELFSITALTTESTTTAPTYTETYTDIFPGFVGSTASQSGGLYTDLQEYRYKIAADYKGDVATFLELNKRLQYDTDRDLDYDNSGANPEVTGSGTATIIQDLKLIYESTEILLNDQSISATADWVHVTEPLDVYSGSGTYVENFTIVRSSSLGTGPSSGKIVSADLRYGYIHIYRYIENPQTYTITLGTPTDEEYSYVYTGHLSGEQDLANGYFDSTPALSQQSAVTGDNTMVYSSPIHVTPTTASSRRTHFKSGDWIRGRETNWSARDDSYTIAGKTLDLPVFDDVVHTDVNDETNLEILGRKNEWLYNSYLYFNDEIIYEYSEGDLDVLSPIYTTELQHELKGVI